MEKKIQRCLRMMRKNKEFNYLENGHFKELYMIDAPPTVQKIPKRIVTILPKIINSFEGLVRFSFFLPQSSEVASALRENILSSPTNSVLLKITKINPSIKIINPMNKLLIESIMIHRSFSI